MQKPVLIAGLPEPAEFIRRSIEKKFPASYLVHSFDDAIHLLSEHEFGLIICGLHFDECRMMELLWRVKEMPEYRETPFLCVRALEAHFETTESVKAAHEALGAVGFLEIPKMDDDGGRLLLEEIEKLALK